ncbi:MAG: hypothetical protein CSA26_00835 [Desulfobacterales bacterium]|nr:MAG: hypothetical protein CSA26_00835 [Desulfobacterales bacterium]
MLVVFSALVCGSAVVLLLLTGVGNSKLKRLEQVVEADVSLESLPTLSVSCHENFAIDSTGALNCTPWLIGWHTWQLRTFWLFSLLGWSLG